MELPLTEFCFRTAEKKDEEDLFLNRNDTVTRKASNHVGSIAQSEHTLWYKQALLAKHRQLYILEHHSLPVGFSRIDDWGEWQLLSWGIYPRYRCKGYGSVLLLHTLEKTQKIAYAQILSDNTASNKLALKVGLQFFFNYADSNYYYYRKNSSVAAACRSHLQELLS